MSATNGSINGAGMSGDATRSNIHSRHQQSNHYQPRRPRGHLNDTRRGGHVIQRSSNDEGGHRDQPGQRADNSNNRGRRRRGGRGGRNNNDREGDRQQGQPQASTSHDNNSQLPPPAAINTNRGFRPFNNVRAMTARSRMTVEESADPESQRKQWEQLLQSGSYECMICCEEIKVTDQIWNCFISCHNIFHLDCISTWACSEVAAVASTANQGQTSSAPLGSQDGSAGWRCPACQSPYQKFPNRYYCFCGKKRDPPINPRNPHSCGLVCFKRRGKGCPHKCPLFCHPGPCPPCDVGVSQPCGCGRTNLPVRCGSSQSGSLSCGKTCDRLLTCEKHPCESKCHPGPCPPCQKTETTNCYCGKTNKTYQCSQGLPSSESYDSGGFSCEQICARKLDCKQHTCQEVCHPGDCGTCSLLPSVAKTCPCGKKLLSSFEKKGKGSLSIRTSCTDPLPSCFAICGKELSCGPVNSPHTCDKKCHTGSCGPCKLTTTLKCRCGGRTETIPCQELPPNRVFICNRKCNKTLSCGRHKCPNSCCPKDDNHVCVSTCGKRLSCRQHKCQEVCHPGNCPSCWNVSWEEVTCHCRQSSIFPPVPCGTPIPTCNRPCTRSHSCSHPVTHTCHNEEECPPCTHPTTKTCFGGHHVMSNVLCCQTGISCGKPCKREMPCHRHECQRPCHEGPCGSCIYPCGQAMKCGHVCTQTCHGDKVCLPSNCKILVTIHCPCKRLTEKKPCHEIQSRSIVPVTLLARLRLNSDQELDVSELLKKADEDKNCKLECDERCSIIERNRSLAEALDIKDADFTPDPALYSESLKQAYMHYPDFVKETYTVLETLVKECEKKPAALHNFRPMRSDLRAIVHELAEVFGCKSHSVDPEPSRSVIVKAIRGKAAIPSVSIMDFMKDRILTMKKGPSASSSGSSGRQTTTATTSSAKSTSSQPPPQPVIDYFDFTG